MAPRAQTQVWTLAPALTFEPHVVVPNETGELLAVADAVGLAVVQLPGADTRRSRNAAAPTCRFVTGG